jgi:hypothetical protein
LTIQKLYENIKHTLTSPSILLSTDVSLGAFTCLGAEKSLSKQRITFAGWWISASFLISGAGAMFTKLEGGLLNIAKLFVLSQKGFKVFVISQKGFKV